MISMPCWRSNCSRTPASSIPSGTRASVIIGTRCALSLSDNLKPWPLIERRLDAAAQAGFAIALYNPVSRARPWQFASAVERLRRHLPATTPVIVGRAVGRPDERIAVSMLQTAAGEVADMATLVIVGTRETRVIERPGRSPLVYTPRAIPPAVAEAIA